VVRGYWMQNEVILFENLHKWFPIILRNGEQEVFIASLISEALQISSER
jgi:hypothetical protein